MAKSDPSHGQGKSRFGGEDGVVPFILFGVRHVSNAEHAFNGCTSVRSELGRIVLALHWKDTFAIAIDSGTVIFGQDIVFIACWWCSAA